jgi:hypothetical protein
MCFFIKSVRTQERAISDFATSDVADFDAPKIKIGRVKSPFMFAAI